MIEMTVYLFVLFVILIAVIAMCVIAAKDFYNLFKKTYGDDSEDDHPFILKR